MWTDSDTPATDPTYQRERQAHTDFVTLTSAIAAELGAEWKTTPSPNGDVATFQGPQGAHLYLRRGRRTADAGRVTIAGGFTPEQHNAMYKLDGSRITCAMSRGAPTIAREIRRRVLPIYLANQARADAAVITARAQSRSRADALAAIHAAMPADAYMIEAQHLAAYWDGHTRTEATVNPRGETVTLTISLDTTTALRVLALAYQPTPDTHPTQDGAPQ